MISCDSGMSPFSDRDFWRTTPPGSHRNPVTEIAPRASPSGYRTAVGSVIAKRGLERCEVPSDAQTRIERHSLAPNVRSHEVRGREVQNIVLRNRPCHCRLLLASGSRCSPVRLGPAIPHASPLSEALHTSEGKFPASTAMASTATPCTRKSARRARSRRFTLHHQDDRLAAVGGSYGQG